MVVINNLFFNVFYILHVYRQEVKELGQWYSKYASPANQVVNLPVKVPLAIRVTTMKLLGDFPLERLGFSPPWLFPGVLLTYLWKLKCS